MTAAGGGQFGKGVKGLGVILEVKGCVAASGPSHLPWVSLRP